MPFSRRFSKGAETHPGTTVISVIPLNKQVDAKRQVANKENDKTLSLQTAELFEQLKSEDNDIIKNFRIILQGNGKGFTSLSFHGLRLHTHIGNCQ